MAEVFVSPGVYTQEMDDTFSPPPGAAAIGAALVGFTKKGPAFLPTTVNSFGQFRDCLLYTSPSPRDGLLSRMPSSA